MRRRHLGSRNRARSGSSLTTTATPLQYVHASVAYLAHYHPSIRPSSSAPLPLSARWSTSRRAPRLSSPACRGRDPAPNAAALAASCCKVGLNIPPLLMPRHIRLAQHATKRSHRYQFESDRILIMLSQVRGVPLIPWSPALDEAP